MRRYCFFLMAALTAVPAAAQALTGREILEKVDGNLFAEKAVSRTRMVIHSRTGSRTVESIVWTKGKDRALVEYTSPAREKGKKMLKLGDKLWTYTPEPNDRIIAISGHLLRQAVMGSDLSYEDITENTKLTEDYEATLVGEEEVEGRNCHVLQLTAVKQDLAYHGRKVWIDAERWLPLREDRFAKSGRLLKTTRVLEALRVDERWYPKRMTFKDMLSRGQGTEYLVESIDFKADIPDHMLTKASLRK